MAERHKPAVVELLGSILGLVELLVAPLVVTRVDVLELQALVHYFGEEDL